MTGWGQSRPMRSRSHDRACPLRLSKRTICTPSQQVRLAVIADIRGTGVTEYLVASRGSLRVDTHRLDHLGPFFGFVGDELIEIDGRAHQRRATELGEPRLDPGIG